MSPLIGTTLDKYEVLQKVGEGGMATVYRGRHTTLNRDVAIKVLHPHLSSSARNRKRFAREARAIEHLKHDNILQIFDYSGLDADECYIITEFVEGETVSAVLRRRGSFPSEVTAIVGLRLAEALAYAHTEGILHRDLKPDNVMVRWDGTVKLMDFGIARFLDESQVTMTGALVGSPAFMSPEQAREQPLDLRSDLFSLGTMLFYLVTGHLPFNGSNPSLILKNVIEGNRSSVSELAPSMSATLADVIERLMTTSPEDRYNDAREVLRGLESALAEANVDPEDPRWLLSAWLEDADAYERRLDEHLREVLLLRGRQHLNAGDHLAALRLFNRLLSMDEDNPEVLALVQSMHGEVRRRPTAGIVGFLGVVGVVALGGAWLLWTSRTPEQLDADRAAITANTAEHVLEDGPRALAGDPPPAPPQPRAPEPVDAPVAAAEGPDTRTDAPIVGPDEAPGPREGTSPPTVPRARISRPTRTVALAPTPEPSVDELPAELLIRSEDLYGEIYIDGQKRGNTRDIQPIRVPPGRYDVVVQSPVLKPVLVRVDVGPGERFERTVALEPLPGELEFRQEDWPEHCKVLLDGATAGTVGQLGRVLRIDRPDEPHEVVVECNDARTSKSYDYVTPGARFPPP